MGVQIYENHGLLMVVGVFRLILRFYHFLIA